MLAAAPLVSAVWGHSGAWGCPRPGLTASAATCTGFLPLLVQCLSDAGASEAPAAREAGAELQGPLLGRRPRTVARRGLGAEGVALDWRLGLSSRGLCLAGVHAL